MEREEMPLYMEGVFADYFPQGVINGLREAYLTGGKEKRDQMEHLYKSAESGKLDSRTVRMINSSFYRGKDYGKEKVSKDELNKKRIDAVYNRARKGVRGSTF